MIFVTLNTEPLVSKYCYVLVLFPAVMFVYSQLEKLHNV